MGGLRVGEAVEVCSKGAWYPATLLRKRGSQCSIEFKGDEDKSKVSKKWKIGADAIRPAPPCLVRQHFVADEIVDASDKDGWWTGTIQNVLPDNNYLVRFTHSGEKLEYHVSHLRLHLDLVDGHWLQPSHLGIQPSEKTVRREAEGNSCGVTGERDGGESERKRRKRSKGKDKVGSSGRGTMKMSMNMNTAGTRAGRDVAEGAKSVPPYKERGKCHSSAPQANVSSSKQTQVPIAEQVENVLNGENQVPIAEQVENVLNGEAETTVDAAASSTLKKIELLAFDSVLSLLKLLRQRCKETTE